MRRVLFISVFFLGISISAFSQENLIFNPSFEQGNGNIVYGWFAQPPQVQGITRIWESSIARTGTRCISIEKNNSKVHASWAQIVKPEKNKVYSVKTFTRTKSGTLSYVVVMSFWRDGVIDQKPSFVKIAQASSKKWNELKFQFLFPHDADSLLFMLELFDQSGKIYFDDISMKELNIQQSDAIAFNCGSQEIFYDAVDSALFLPDRPYSLHNKAGFVNSIKPPDKDFGRDIIGGADGKDIIYFDARYGFSEYKFDLENGLYAVQLHFCENEFNGKGFRKQTVIIEDEMVLEDFDAVEFADKSYAITFRYLADIHDGQLNIRFSASEGNTMLSALSVKRITSNTIPPGIPGKFSVIGGFNQNILNWEPNFEDDFKGFNIYRKPADGDFELITSAPYPLSRYIDDDVEAGKEYSYKVVAVDLFDNASQETGIIQVAPVSKADSKLPVYELFISEENFHKLNEDIYSDEYVSAAFKFNGKAWDVEVRYRGNVTQKLSKKNYKVKFDENDSFEGVEKLNLNATMNDPSMMIDQLTYSLRRDIGILTQNTMPVHLELNGRFIGVYLQREQEDKDFLTEHGLPYGNIYRSQRGNFEMLGSLEEYEFAYEKETNTSSSYDDLIELIEFINLSGEEEFKEEFPKMFNVGEFLEAYAILNCVADIDQHFHNFLLIHNFKDDGWRICNWDHNCSFGNPNTPVDLNTSESPSPIGNRMNFLFDRMFHIDDFRYYYITKLLEYADNIFSPEQMNERIDDYVNLIYFDALRDIYKYGWENNDYWTHFVAVRKKFVQDRVAYIKNEAPKFLPQDFNPYNNSLFINEISRANGEKGFVEIYNNGVIPLDISGFTLSDDEGVYNKFVFPNDAVIQPKDFYVVYLQDGFGIDLKNNGGWLGLFSAEGNIYDSLSYPELSDNNSYGREYDNLSVFTEFETPTPNEENKEVILADIAVVINEFMASNTSTIEDEKGNYGDWIELYNNSDEEVDIGGYYMTDDLETPFEWQLPDNTKISANGFLLIWADGNTEDGPLHATFKLSANGESIGLFSPDGKAVVDTISFGFQNEDISFGRNGDAAQEWVFFDIPTPGATNTKIETEIHPVVINELMASNSKTIQDESGAYPDWIELYNNSDEEIDISGFYITDEPMGDPAQWRIPNGTKIKARGFLLLWADNDPEEGPYHTNYKLSKDGDSVAIYAQDGKTLIDLIAFGQQETDISYGRKYDADDEWVNFNIPTPGESNNSVGVDEYVHSDCTLNQNYPNPFSESTNISFNLSHDSFVSLLVIDMLGREIRNVHSGYLESGDYSFVFNREGLPVGVYFYQLRVNNKILTRKMIIK